MLSVASMPVRRKPTAVFMQSSFRRAKVKPDTGLLDMKKGDSISFHYPAPGFGFQWKTRPH